MTDYKLLAGIKISVFIPFANIAKISSTLKFVVLQYTVVLLITLYHMTTIVYTSVLLLFYDTNDKTTSVCVWCFYSFKFVELSVSMELYKLQFPAYTLYHLIGNE